MELAPVPGAFRLQGEESNISAWGQLLGDTRPDGMILAHWAGISKYKYLYEDITPSLNIADSHNRYGTADTALALYWGEKNLAPGEERVYEILYGVGDIKGTKQELDCGLRLVAPDMLTLNEAEDGYVDQFFTVSLELDHTLGGTGAPVYENIEATLDLAGARGSLRLVGGEEGRKQIPYLLPGQIKSLSWMVEAFDSYAPRAARLQARVSIAGRDPVLLTAIVLIPSLAGDPPPIQMLGAAPNIIHVGESDRKVSLRGSGFNNLWFDRTWKLTIEREANPQDVVLVADSEKEDYFNITGDTQLDVLLPNELWGGQAPKLEAYWLKLEAEDEEGRKTFSQKITFTDRAEYRTFSYGILSLCRLTEAKTYGLRPTADDAAHAKGLGSGVKEELVTIRGQIVRKTGQLPGYNGPYYEIAPGAVLNQKVHYDEDDEIAAAFGEGYQRMYVYENKGSVMLAGTGRLSLPGTHFYTGDFTVKLEQGFSYSLDPESGENGITFEWPDTEPWFQPVVWMRIYPVFVTRAVLQADRVTFQGKLLFLLDAIWDREAVGRSNSEMLLNLFNMSMNVHKAVYTFSGNEVSFEALQGRGEIGLLDKIIPIKTMKFGARAIAEIDTLARQYRFEAHLRFMVLEADVLVKLADARGHLIPDEISLEVKLKPGIPITFATPVVWITQGGGGISGLAGTINGKYNCLPPVRFYLIGGANIAKVATVSDLTLVLSPQELSFSGAMGIVYEELIDIPILEYLGAKLKFDDALGSLSAEIRGTVNIWGILKGEGRVDFRFTPGANYGIFGPVYVGGQFSCGVYIPDEIPLVGGSQLTGVSLEFSTKKIYADTLILTCPVWIEYVWGEKGITIGAEKPTWLGGRPPGMSDVDSLAGGLQVRGPDGQPLEGRLVVGGNWHTLGTTENDSIPLGPEGITSGEAGVEVLPKGLRTMAIMGDMGEPPLVVSNGTFTEHQLTMHGLDTGMIVLRFAGDVPGYRGLSVDDVEVFDPEGKKLDLITDPGVEGANSIWQEVNAGHDDEGNLVQMKERRLAIGIPDPMDGVWTVKTKVSTTSLALIDAKRGRRIENFELTPAAGDATGHEFEVTWDVARLQGGEKMALAVCGWEMEEGKVVKEAGSLFAENINPHGGRYVGTLPAELAGGDYYLRAILYEENEEGIVNYHSCHSEDSIAVVNRFEPSAPADVKVTAIGGGNMEVRWQAPVGGYVDGYLLQVLDEDGNTIPTAGAVELAADEIEFDKEKDEFTVVLGGTFRAPSPHVEPGGDGPDFSHLFANPGEELGLLPGKTYRAAVLAYRAKGEGKYYSSPAISGPVPIPIPNPATVTYSLWDASGRELRAEDDEHGPFYVSPGGQAELRLTSDQDLTSLEVAGMGLGSQEMKAVAGGQEQKIPLSLPEGSHRLSILAVNDAGDMNEAGLRITVDTTPPGLFLEPGQITGTEFIVRGAVEPGSKLTIGGQPFTPSEAGLFGKSISVGNAFTAETVVVATDSAGHESRALVTAVRTDKLARLRLEPSVPTGKINVKQGETLALQAMAYDEAGEAYPIPNALVDFQVLSGAGLLQEKGPGQWLAQEAGQATISAGFRVAGPVDNGAEAGLPGEQVHPGVLYDSVLLNIYDPVLGPDDNRAPRLVQPLTKQEVSYGQTLRVDLSGVFMDPDGDELTLSQQPAPEGDNMGSVEGSAWVYTPSPQHAVGEYEVTLLATDSGGKRAVHTFTVKLVAGGGGHLPPDPEPDQEEQPAWQVTFSQTAAKERLCTLRATYRLVSEILTAKRSGATSFTLDVSGVLPKEGEFDIMRVELPAPVAGHLEGLQVTLATPLATVDLPQTLADDYALGEKGLAFTLRRAPEEALLAAIDAKDELLTGPLAITSDFALAGVTVTLPYRLALPGQEGKEQAFLDAFYVLALHGEGEAVKVKELGFEIDDASRTLKAVQFPAEALGTFALVQGEAPADEKEQASLLTSIGGRSYSLNGKTKAFDNLTAYRASDGATVMAVRLLEDLGALINYRRVDGLGVVTVSYGGVRATLREKSAFMTVADGSGERQVTLRALFTNQGGRTYLPTRDVAENLGFRVHWSAADDTITIGAGGR